MCNQDAKNGRFPLSCTQASGWLRMGGCLLNVNPSLMVEAASVYTKLDAF
jgi:hypothetical protein